MNQWLKELKRETDNSIVIVEDFNIPFSMMCKTMGQQSIRE